MNSNSAPRPTLYSYAHSNVPADSFEASARFRLDLLTALRDIIIEFDESGLDVNSRKRAAEAYRNAIISLVAEYPTVIWPNWMQPKVPGKTGQVIITSSRRHANIHTDIADKHLGFGKTKDGENALEFRNMAKIKKENDWDVEPCYYTFDYLKSWLALRIDAEQVVLSAATALHEDLTRPMVPEVAGDGNESNESNDENNNENNEQAA